jgi:hypothetical protein
MVVREPQERRLSKVGSTESFASLTAAVLRANAIAWVLATYPHRFDQQFVVAAHRAADGAFDHTKSDSSAVRIAAQLAAAAVDAITESILAADAAAKGVPSPASIIKARSVSNTAEKIAISAASFDYTSIWEEVRVDADKLLEFNPSLVMVGPLWSGVAPRWHETAWVELNALLRSGRCDVWADWYEQRLLGGTRGENSELLFAGVPTEIWDSGLAAASSWITAHLPPHNLEKPPETDINDEGALEAWLNGQSRDVAVAIAARAAMRVVPLVVRAPEKEGRNEDVDGFLMLTGAVLRACAVAWVSARYPSRLDRLVYAASAARAAAGFASRRFAAEKEDDHYDKELDGNRFIANMVARASSEAAQAVSVDTAADVASATANATSSAAHALGADFDEPSTNTAAYAAAAFWREVRVDIAASRTEGARDALADLPLWLKGGSPPLTKEEWASLHEALPEGEDWEVWIDWYENRLRGGSQGESYELVFASVPPDIWDQGPAAANAWIREHLPPADGDGLKQQAALYSFQLTNGRIAVAPEEARPEDAEATRDFLEESRHKAAELRERSCARRSTCACSARWCFSTSVCLRLSSRSVPASCSPRCDRWNPMSALTTPRREGRSTRPI